VRFENVRMDPKSDIVLTLDDQVCGRVVKVGMVLVLDLDSLKVDVRHDMRCN
jgi:hypothetical protein